MTSEQPRRSSPVPPIVGTVLTQAARLLMKGEISREIFKAQADRITAEELNPRGLSLYVEELEAGRIRFCVTEKQTGNVCATIDCAANAAAGASATDEVEINRLV